MSEINNFNRKPNSSQPIFNVPSIIVLLIGLMGAIHACSVYLLSDQQRYEFVFGFGFIPSYFSAAEMDRLPDLLTLTTPVSYSLLHADWTHLIINSIWMLAFGSVVARRTGTFWFIVFCLFASVSGAVFHFGFNATSFVPMIGASAVVSACMGAAMRFAFPASGGFSMQAHDLPLQSISQSFRNRQVVAFIVVWFGLNIAFGLGGDFVTGSGGSIAWQAHIGGFLFGLLGFGLFDRLSYRR